MCSPFNWNEVQYTIVLSSFQTKAVMKLKSPTASIVAQKTVLVRVDFNAPLQDGRVTDSRRIEAALDTIKFLQKNQAKIVLISHLGRPKNQPESKYSLKPVADFLVKKLDLPVTFADDCIGDQVQKLKVELKPGEILLLENTRFHAAEKENKVKFAQQLAAGADLFINEAFSASHRAHASTVGVTKYLPSYAGFSLQQEVAALQQLLDEPKSPFIIIVGGAKISDKIGALENLLEAADAVLVGGGVANNFLKAEGLETHKSYLQDAPADLKKQGIDYIQIADELIEETKTERILKDGYIPLPKILYPLDVVAAQDASSDQTEIIDLTHDAQDTPDDRNLMYLDIGPKTIRLYSEIIKQAKSIFWNGPMGVFEQPAFAQGTKKIAQAIAENDGTTILGGGDTAAAVEKYHLEDQYSYVSTAGGAGLVFLSGAELPGLTPLLL